MKFSALGSTGGTEIEKASTPGLEYDPKSDRMVAWSGGGTVYSLDLDKKAWTRHDPAPTGGPIPGAANTNGTFGRFRYSPGKNVFVAVSSVTTNVFVYKLAPGAGVPQPEAGVAPVDGGPSSPGTSEAGSPEVVGAQPDGGHSNSNSGCGCRTARGRDQSQTGLLTAIVLACFGYRRSRLSRNNLNDRSSSVRRARPHRLPRRR